MRAAHRKKNRKLNTHTVILSWIFSYLTIVSIPLLISIFLMTHSLNYMKSENKQICQEELNNLSVVLDNYFTEMNRISLEFSLNPQVTALTNTTNFTSQEHYALYELYRELQYYKVSNSSISHIGMFFLDSDTILTSTGVDSLSGKAPDIFGKEMSTTLASLGFQNRFYYLDENHTFLYLLSIPLSDSSPYRNYMFVTLDPHIWDEITANQGENSFFVTFSESAPPYTLDSDSLTLTADSVIPSISYTLIFRNTDTEKHIKFIQLLMITSTVLCFIVSIALAFFFTRKNYNPLSQLIVKIAASNSRNNGNEYNILEKYIDTMQSESFTMKKELSKNHEMLDNEYLSKLLRNIYSKEDYTYIARLPLWQHPQEAEEKTLAVLTVYANYSAAELTSDESVVNDIALLHFILKNMLGDLIPEDISWQSISHHKNFITVLHGTFSVLEQLCSTVTAQLPPLLNTYKVQIHIGISIGYVTIPNVVHLYHESLEALECSILYNLAYMYYGPKIKQQNDTARTTQHLGTIYQKFWNAVTTQQYDSAAAVIPELFENIFLKDQSLSMIRLNMYSLITLYRSCLMDLNKKQPHIYPLIDQQLNELLNSTSLDMLRERLYSCLTALKAEQNKHFSSSGDVLIEEIKKYIKTHYSDSNLSAGLIAEQFQMPLSTVSKLFKKHTQTGMLDYIHHVRIKHAKSLLQTQKYTVNEVSAMTGYLSASSFIRTFKKYEGISPGVLLESRPPV